MKTSIKFSHRYEKMPLNIMQDDTVLLDVFVTDEISERFRMYDTLIKGKNPFYSESYYQLPEGKLLVLLLKTDAFLWTTIRRWTLEKEQYYKSIRGKEILVLIE